MQTTKLTTLILASILTLLGLFVLICWHLGAEHLLTFGQCNWPTPYQAGLNILLSGLALFSMLHPRGSSITKWIGALILLNLFFAGHYLIYQTDFGFSDFLISILPFANAPFSHIVKMGLFSFGLMGFLCLLWNIRKKSTKFNTFSLILSLLILFSGTLFVLSYFLPIKIPIGWTEAFPIQCLSAASVFLLGIGLLNVTLYWENQIQLNTKKTKAILISFGFFLFTLIVAIGFQLQKNDFVEKIMKGQASETQKIVEEKLQQSLDFATGISSNMARAGSSSHANWDLNVKNWMMTNSSIIDIIWLDDHFQEKTNVSNLLFPIPDELKQNMEDKAKKKLPFISIAQLPKSRYVLMIATPIYSNETLQGEIIEVFDVEKYFQKTLSMDDNFVIHIKEKDVVISQESIQSLKSFSQWKKDIHLSLDDFHLTLTLYPSGDFSAFYIRDVNTYIILCSGFIISLILGGMLYQWQQSEHRLSILRKTELERNLILTSANIGTWNLDIKKETFKFDIQALYLFSKKRENQNLSLEEFISSVVEVDRDFAKETFRRSLTSLTPIDATFKVIYPNGSIHSILCRGQALYDHEILPNRFIGILWDISATIQAKRLLGASEAIAKILGKSQNLTESLSNLIQVLHQFLDWEVLVFWYQDPKKKLLTCLEISMAHGVTALNLAKVTRKMEIPDKITFSGQIWGTFDIVSLEDIAKEPNFKRQEAAIQDDIHGALAFSIFEDDKLTGLVELFKKAPFIGGVSEQLSHFIKTVSIELGQFVKRKKIENNQIQLTALINSSVAAIFHTDTNGIVQSWNFGAENIYGWDHTEMIGEIITKTYPKERLPEFEMLLNQLRRGEHVEHFQSERICKNGTRIWVENTISPMLGPNQEVVGFSVISLNITEQKEAAQNLHKTEKKFQDFIETIEEWIWEMDQNMIFTYSNPYVQQILGFSEKEIIGKSLLNFIPEEERQKAEKEIQNFVDRKKAWTSHILTWKHKNGSLCYLESNAEPVFDENHEFIGFRGADRNVSERINMEKSKDEFISMVSHELRTPLTSIYASLGLLLEEKGLSQNHLELLKIAERNCERLTALINDVLDSEKIQLGKLPLKCTSVSVEKAVQDAITAATQMAEQFQVQIQKTGSFPDVKVFADLSRLVQVILNILSNAIKFSHPHGTVSVFMETAQDVVKVSIQDEGIGIPKSFYPHIFEKFAQADRGNSRSVTGTGLGLSISKNIIEQLDGTIGFTSEEGKGSTFFFTLPIKESC